MSGPQVPGHLWWKDAPLPSSTWNPVVTRQVLNGQLYFRTVLLALQVSKFHSRCSDQDLPLLTSLNLDRLLPCAQPALFSWPDSLKWVCNELLLYAKRILFQRSSILRHRELHQSLVPHSSSEGTPSASRFFAKTKRGRPIQRLVELSHIFLKSAWKSNLYIRPDLYCMHICPDGISMYIHPEIQFLYICHEIPYTKICHEIQFIFICTKSNSWSKKWKILALKTLVQKKSPEHYKRNSVMYFILTRNTFLCNLT